MSYQQIPYVSDDEVWTEEKHNQLLDNQRAGVPDVFTAKGDLAYAAGADQAAVLPIGSERQVLQVGADGKPKWGAVPLEITTAKFTSNYVTSYGALHTIDWNGEDLDEGGWHDNTVEPSRITVKEYGIYQAHAFLAWAPRRCMNFHLKSWILMNGQEKGRFSTLTGTEVADSDISYTIISPPLRANPGDYFQVQAQQYSGTAWNLLTVCRFSVIRLG